MLLGPYLPCWVFSIAVLYSMCQPWPLSCLHIQAKVSAVTGGWKSLTCICDLQWEGQVSGGEKRKGWWWGCFLMRGKRDADTDLLHLISCLITSKWTKNNLHLCQGRFWLGIRKNFFTQKVAGHCNRLPREVATAWQSSGYYLDRV